MKLISKVAGTYCIADDFCKEYEPELNKKALLLSLNRIGVIISTLFVHYRQLLSAFIHFVLHLGIYARA